MRRLALLSAALGLFTACTSTRDSAPEPPPPRSAPPAEESIPMVSEPTEEAREHPADEAPIDCAGHRSGETWKEDCNTCSCDARGQISCTLMACAEPDK